MYADKVLKILRASYQLSYKNCQVHCFVFKASKAHFLILYAIIGLKQIITERLKFCS